MSLHRYDKKTFYPGKDDAQVKFIGKKKTIGIGYNVNVAWDTPTNKKYQPGANEYRFAFETVVLPIAQEFQPDLILVACGFDSANYDEIN